MLCGKSPKGTNKFDMRSEPWEWHKDRRNRPDMRSMMNAAKQEAERIVQQLSTKEDEYLDNRADLDRLCSILGDIDAVADSAPNSPIMRSEEYRRIVDSTAIVSKADKNGIITYVNAEFCRVSGYDYSELIGKPHNIIRHPDMPKEIFDDMWKTITEDKKMWEGTIKNKKKSGEAYYVDARISPQVSDEGEILGFIAIRFDVTEKTLLKEQQNEIINHQKELTRLILDEQSNIVVVATKEEGIISANKAFFETLPYNSLPDFTRDHFCVCDLFIEFDGVAGPLSAKKWFEAIREEGGMVSHKVKMMDRSGDIKTFSAIAKTASSGSEKDNHYFVITLSDITQAESETDAARKEALAAHQESYAKSTFLANMSHEIRTPLNGIIPIIDLIEESELTREQHEYISIVKRSAKSLLQIINDILDFSKIEAGSFDIEEIDFDPIKELESIVDLFVAKASEKNIRLCIFIDPNLPSCVLGDPLRIKQVISNLLGNAVKFTVNGEIDFRVNITKKRKGFVSVRISVRDTGVGIPPERVERIFDPFMQADNSITRKFGGTGLGLAISKNLVEMMGGRLGLESEPGVGSHFYFDVTLKSCVGNVEEARNISKKIGVCIANNDLERCARVLFEYLKAFGFQHKLVSTIEDCDECDVLMVVTSGMDNLPWIQEAYDQGIRVVSVIPQNRKNRNRFSSHVTIAMPVNGSKIYDSIIETDGRKNKAIETIESHTKYGKYHGKVLVAEDNPTNQQIAIAILRRMGLEPIIANDGAEAVNLVQDAHWINNYAFDLILMDIHMPVMNGVEATRQIREFENELKNTHTPIIALTADALKGREQEYLAEGMDYYISKPIDKDEFITAIERFIGHLKVIDVPDEDIDIHDAMANGATDKVSIVADALGLDREMAQFLLDDFFNNWGTYEARLKTAVETNNLEEIQSVAHALKGAASSLRLDDIYDIAKRMEEEARERLESDYLALFERLKIEIDRG